MAAPIAVNSGRRWRWSGEANKTREISNTVDSQAAGECGTRRGSGKAGSGRCGESLGRLEFRVLWEGDVADLGGSGGSGDALARVWGGRD